MNPPLRSLLLTFILQLSSSILLHAAPPPELALLRAQYEKVFAERVTSVHEAAVAALDAKFTTALDNAIAQAQGRGRSAHRAGHSGRQETARREAAAPRR